MSPSDQPAPAASQREPAPLAQLWGFPAGTSSGVASTALPSRPGSGVLKLGEGMRIRTSGGLVVQLPDGESGPVLASLEKLAYQILSEAYRTIPEKSHRLLQAYYRLRPFIPRKLQLVLRRRHARGRAARSWLGWPIDGTWVALAEAYLVLQLIENSGAEPLRLWPEGSRAAVILTHDVEGTIGQDRCLELAAMEEQHGFRSCFNFVAERYPVDQALVATLRARGHEIGLHGIKHDGLKFSSRPIFEERLVALERYRKAWQVEGFRSPATHRRWEWMEELPFLYDSSFPDTDPYEPIPGGSGSPWPFHFGRLIELPITMPQDHTLWEILCQPATPSWGQKLDWLVRCRGLVNIIIHPDYLTTPARWAEYQAFLLRVQATPELWTALPRDVAHWWSTRSVRQPVRVQRDGSDWSLTFS